MKSINSQSARNAGIAAVGFAAMLIMYQWVGYFALLSAFIVGVGTYINDVHFDNAPSKLDPLVALAGGLLACALIYARHYL